MIDKNKAILITNFESFCDWAKVIDSFYGNNDTKKDKYKYCYEILKKSTNRLIAGFYSNRICIPIFIKNNGNKYEEIFLDTTSNHISNKKNYYTDIHKALRNNYLKKIDLYIKNYNYYKKAKLIFKLFKHYKINTYVGKEINTAEDFSKFLLFYDLYLNKYDFSCEKIKKLFNKNKFEEVVLIDDFHFYNNFMGAKVVMYINGDNNIDFALKIGSDYKNPYGMILNYFDNSKIFLSYEKIIKQLKIKLTRIYINDINFLYLKKAQRKEIVKTFNKLRK